MKKPKKDRANRFLWKDGDLVELRSGCERCKKESRVTSGSYFNTQMICPDCDEKEQRHPLFQKAKETEAEEVRKGNYNFPGIGLPKDLR